MNGPITFREFYDQGKTSFSDAEVVHLYFSNTHLRVKEIAELSGRPVAEIYRLIHGAGGRPNRQITNHHNVRMFADSGLPVKQVASLTGYTPRNVRYVLKKGDQQNNFSDI